MQVLYNPSVPPPVSEGPPARSEDEGVQASIQVRREEEVKSPFMPLPCHQQEHLTPTHHAMLSFPLPGLNTTGERDAFPAPHPDSLVLSTTTAEEQEQVKVKRNALKRNGPVGQVVGNGMQLLKRVTHGGTGWSAGVVLAPSSGGSGGGMSKSHSSTGTTTTHVNARSSPITSPPPLPRDLVRTPPSGASLALLDMQASFVPPVTNNKNGLEMGAPVSAGPPDPTQYGLSYDGLSYIAAGIDARGFPVAPATRGSSTASPSSPFQEARKESEDIMTDTHLPTTAPPALLPHHILLTPPPQSPHVLPSTNHAGGSATYVPTPRPSPAFGTYPYASMAGSSSATPFSGASGGGGRGEKDDWRRTYPRSSPQDGPSSVMPTPQGTPGAFVPIFAPPAVATVARGGGGGRGACASVVVASPASSSCSSSSSLLLSSAGTAATPAICLRAALAQTTAAAPAMALDGYPSTPDAVREPAPPPPVACDMLGPRPEWCGESPPGEGVPGTPVPRYHDGGPCSRQGGEARGVVVMGEGVGGGARVVLDGVAPAVASGGEGEWGVSVWAPVVSQHDRRQGLEDGPEPPVVAAAASVWRADHANGSSANRRMEQGADASGERAAGGREEQWSRKRWRSDLDVGVGEGGAGESEGRRGIGGRDLEGRYVYGGGGDGDYHRDYRLSPQPQAHVTDLPHSSSSSSSSPSFTTPLPPPANPPTLPSLESIIHTSLSTGDYFRAGAALSTVHTLRLFTPLFRTIYTYAKQRFSLHRRTTNTYLRGWSVYRTLAWDPALPLPKCVSHVRGLNKFDPVLRRFLWKKAHASAAAGPQQALPHPVGTPTTSTVTEALVDSIVAQYEADANVSNDSDEFYTPIDVIRAAQRVIGKRRFDLDPASCEFANERAEIASVFYGRGRGREKEAEEEEGGGLQRKWFGDVWLSPPCSEEAETQTEAAAHQPRPLADGYAGLRCGEGRDDGGVAGDHDHGDTRIPQHRREPHQNSSLPSPPPTRSSPQLRWLTTALAKYATGEIHSLHCLLRLSPSTADAIRPFPHCILTQLSAFCDPTGAERTFHDGAWAVVYRGPNEEAFCHHFEPLGIIPGYNSWSSSSSTSSSRCRSACRHQHH